MFRWTGLFLIACTALWAQNAPGTGKIDLTVSTDGAGRNPIPGANVTWTGPDNQSHTGVTAADGHLRLANLTPGVYRVQVRAAGYTGAFRGPGVSPAYVVADNTAVLYATMIPLGAIRGTVTGEDGNPVAGAVVAVAPAGLPASPRSQRTATTDAEGHYLIADLSPAGPGGARGGWDMKAYLPLQRAGELGKTFEPAYSENIAIQPGSTQTVGLQLRSAPSFHIRGRVADKPAAEGAVSIRECDGGAQDDSASYISVASDGSFDAGGLIPGAYCLAFEVAQGSYYKLQSSIFVGVIHDRDLDQVELKAQP